MSSLGGLPVITKILQDSGLLELINSKLPEWRKGEVDLPKSELLLQRILLVVCGLPDAIDCSIYKDDPSLLSCLGKHCDRSGGSQSTHTRMEQAVSDAVAKSLEDVFLEFFFSRHKHAPQKLDINFDGTDIRTYGHQQGATFRGGKYKQEQFFPLIATTSTGDLLTCKLRAGKASDGNAREDIMYVVLAIKSRWPRTKITVRIDTGFNDPDLLADLEASQVHYQCGYPYTSALASASREQNHFDIEKSVEAEFRKCFGEPKFIDTHGKRDSKKFQLEHTRIRELPKAERLQAERELANRLVRKVVAVKHLGTGWDSERRVIVRYDYTDSGLDVRAVVTDQPYGLPELIYENGYCSRSKVEFSIKEHKVQCRVPLSCQEFTANRFRFVLQGLAYQVLHMLRKLWKPDRCVATVRECLIRIPVLIVSSPRKLYWHLSSAHPYSAELIRIATKLSR